MIKNNIETGKITKFPYTGGWHTSREYEYLRVTGVITGCGLAQMVGVVTYLNPRNIKNFKKLLKQITTDYKKDGAGGIICTLGEDFWEKEKFLLSCKFELLSEYHNYTHGPTYKQRLYILRY